MTPLITSMGEVLIDFLPIEEDGRVVGFRMHAGGSLLNVAVAAARLGARSALVSKAGDDWFGRFLRAHLDAAGVDTRWIPSAAAPSTIGFVAVEDGEPVYTFYGEGAADTLLTPDDLPPAFYDETAVLHVGSISLLRGSTPGTVLGAFRRLRGRALLSIDPNLRPGMVRDEAAYRDLLDELIAMADVVKVSAADLAWLTPGRDVAEVAGELLERGPALVAITRGGEGVLALHRTATGPTSVELPAFAVEVADTVGAGDSFNAGLLVQLAERGATSRTALETLPDADLADALHFAAAVAALNCTRPGADPPRRPEVEAFLGAAAGSRA